MILLPDGLPQAQEREDEHDHNYQADEINQPVHGATPFISTSAKLLKQKNVPESWKYWLPDETPGMKGDSLKAKARLCTADRLRPCSVYEYQKGTEKRSLKWIKAGSSWFSLSDGTPVDKVDDNTLKIPTIESVLHRRR